MMPDVRGKDNPEVRERIQKLSKMLVLSERVGNNRYSRDALREECDDNDKPPGVRTEFLEHG